MIMHPADYRKLSAAEDLIRQVAKLPPITPSNTAIAAHKQADTPGTPITDPETLDRLFG